MSRWPLVLLLLLGGCSSQVSEFYRDPDFTEQSLRAGGVAVAGLVSVADADDPEVRARRTEALLRTLRERRSDLGLAAPGALPIAVGEEELTGLLDAYRLTGRFTPEQLVELRRARGSARYLVFGRVDLDVHHRDHDRTEEVVAGRLRYDIEPVARREVGVTFDVLDLDAQRLVWSAYLRRIDQNRGQRLTYEPLETEPTEAETHQRIVDLLREQDGPEPPPLEQVLETLARDLARALPGKAD